MGGRYRHSEDKPPLTQGSPGIVTLRGGTKRHSFCDGDLVIFSDIEGMVELNGDSPQPVRVQEDGSLEIGDTATFSRYLRGGVVTEVKRPKTVRHVSTSTSEVGAPGYMKGCVVS